MPDHATAAVAETCNGKDDDCNGKTDENLLYFGKSLGATCKGLGLCGQGTVVCSPMLEVAVCSTDAFGTAPQSQAEVCDGSDNDCDGLTDEGMLFGDLPLGAKCVGAGACGKVQGVVQCSKDGGVGAICSTMAGGTNFQGKPEVCNGQDDDCDGQTDEATCDDGKPCTLDVCDGPNGCKSSPLDGTPCDADGSGCTENDSCKAGVCTPGKAKDCDDKNPCTADSCDPAKGCVNAPTADAKCGTVVPPDAENFACKSLANGQWLRSDTLAPAGTVRWDFDASPASPAPLSPDCSLNVNNGKDLACGAEQAAIAATADSPWFEASGIARS
mgnify:CR=1 FL=1